MSIAPNWHSKMTATFELDSRVLDSWAILAWIRNEPAAARVEQILRHAAAGTSPMAANELD